MRTDRETPDGQGSTARPADVPERWAMSDPEETTSWERVRPREVTDEQWDRFEDAVAEMFTAFGMDLQTEGTHNTPRRFVRAMYEATTGYEGDPKLLTAFPTECRGGPDCSISQVIEGPIPFFALCEHHAFPFYGVAHVGYVAHEQIDRDLEDDEAGPGVRASLHGAGTPRPADRRPPERGDGSARGRRASAGRAPLHADAGGP